MGTIVANGNVYVAVIHTCFEACTYQPRLPVLCKPQGDWKVPAHLLEVTIEVTVNEWVPGAFVLEAKFELADWAVTYGTIPVHTWLSYFQHSQYPSYTGAEGLLTRTIMWDLCCLSLKNIAMWARHWQCSTLDVLMVLTPNYIASDPRRNGLYVKLYLSILYSESDMIFLCFCL